MVSRKGINIYIPKYLMAVRNCTNIFVLLEVFSMVWSNGMNPPSILQQFNWSDQLIIVIFCTSGDSVPSIIWKRSRSSPYRRYFQHAQLIPIVGVGKRGEY